MCAPNERVKRLAEAGYPSLGAAIVAEKKSISPRMHAIADSNADKRVVSIPCTNSVSHRPKLGSGYGVNAVFTAPNNLGKVCAAVQRRNELFQGKKRRDICRVKYTANNNFTDRHLGVFYRIPFSFW